MKRLIMLSLLAFSLFTANAMTPLWLRDVKISPDGSKIAFCYKGDIWTVPVGGGTATRASITHYLQTTKRDSCSSLTTETLISG